VQSCYAKTGNTRTVPLSPDVLAALRKLHDERKPAAEEQVFLLNGKVWKTWRKAFEAASRRAGLTDFRFHDLHHFGKLARGERSFTEGGARADGPCGRQNDYAVFALIAELQAAGDRCVASLRRGRFGIGVPSKVPYTTLQRKWYASVSSLFSSVRP
jgi:hypothetical protein